jgi:hypothetical protein
MIPNPEELDVETIKKLLVTTREKLFASMMANIELETALKIEREVVKSLQEAKSDK